MERKVLIIGSAPNHIGGVAIHIKRLIEYLSEDFIFDVIDESKNITNDFFNIRSLNFITYFKKILNSNVVHIHSGVYFLRCFHFVISKLLFRKVIITIHHDPVVEGRLANHINRFIFPFCKCVIFVNKEGFQSFNRRNNHSNYYMMPAFLPPDLRKEDKLPEELISWIDNKRKENCYILVSNAWKLVVSKGVDLYGLDMCIDVVKRSLSTGNRIAMLFVLVSDGDNKEILSKYNNIIIGNNMEDYFNLYIGSLSFVNLIQQADLVVRPTNTDGDALSIREALFFNVKVLASDVVDRPSGTLLFKTRDNNDFYNKINESKSFENPKSDNNSLSEYLKFYKQIYIS
jgi:glycosyltransferase involved in cell wall biosynthesis